MSKQWALEWSVFGAEPGLSGPERSLPPLSSLPVEKHFSIGRRCGSLAGRRVLAAPLRPRPTTQPMTTMTRKTTTTPPAGSADSSTLWLLHQTDGRIQPLKRESGFLLYMKIVENLNYFFPRMTVFTLLFYFFLNHFKKNLHLFNIKITNLERNHKQYFHAGADLSY